MRIISWNINGLRKHVRDISRIQTLYAPDILCLQEVKLSPPILNQKYYSLNYDYMFASIDPNKPGYAGVIVATNIKPITYAQDTEGRYLSIEFDNFIVINVYTMNASKDLVNLENRIQWESLFREKIKFQMNKNKPIFICGDLNVVHDLEIDIFPRPLNIMRAGLTREEREEFNKLLNMGFIDLFRHKYPTERKYSFLGYQRNVKWRIDYILSNKPELLDDIGYLDHEHGSDHVPMIVDIRMSIDRPGMTQACSSGNQSC